MSRPISAKSGTWRHAPTDFCVFLRRFAQRRFIASEIRFRAAADIVERLADLLILPRGLLRRLVVSRGLYRSVKAAALVLEQLDNLVNVHAGNFSTRYYAHPTPSIFVQHAQ